MLFIMPKIPQVFLLISDGSVRHNGKHPTRLDGNCFFPVQSNGMLLSVVVEANPGFIDFKCLVHH